MRAKEHIQQIHEDSVREFQEQKAEQEETLLAEFHLRESFPPSPVEKIPEPSPEPEPSEFWHYTYGTGWIQPFDLDATRLRNKRTDAQWLEEIEAEKHECDDCD